MILAKAAHHLIYIFFQLINQKKMPFTLLPATVEDAPDIAAIYQAAFADDNIMSYFFPHVPASILLERDINYYRTLIAEGMRYEERVTKVVDDDTG